uniref:Bile acid:sodium symporter family protein n=1 Tax=Anaerolinea thermolimosa TaxID=229919 RepID=A0A7C4PLG2_9CHLR
MIKFSEFVRKHYQMIILLAVAAGLLLGVWSTAPGKMLQNYSQALTFLMILFISLTIPPRQFVQMIRQPLAVIAGLLLNFLFMPLLCWALARLLVSDPALATGIILVGVVPCAGMAAVWTALLKGDVPLGMAINALTMLLAPFLIPPLMIWLAGSDVRIHPWGMFQQLAIILLIPLILGVTLRWVADRFWDPKPYLPLLPALSALTAVLLMFATCNVSIPMIVARWSLIPMLLGAIILIFPLGFLVPHWLGRYIFSREQGIAVTYSSGMKNLPIAVGLALASFPGQALVGLPVALAFILQMLTASTFYRYLRTSEIKAKMVVNEAV